jgi:putative redox protein
MEASTTWKMDEVFSGKSGSGHIVPLDGDPAHRNGASPMELVLVALCGCTAMDVVSILRKKREPLTGLTVSAVAAQAAESPRVFTHVKLIYRVNGAVTKKAAEDAVRLSETKYCTVAAMISKTAKIEYTIEYSGQ